MLASVTTGSLSGDLQVARAIKQDRSEGLWREKSDRGLDRGIEIIISILEWSSILMIKKKDGTVNPDNIEKLHLVSFKCPTMFY